MTTVRELPRTVLAARDPVACETCGRASGLLLARVYRGHGSLCLRCTDLDHLVFLPSADGALTRRARAASEHTVAVDWWNTRRQRRFGYDRRERLGILVEPRALETAARQCLDDPAALADRRVREQRRIPKGGTPWEDVADAIRSRFPGCPRPDVIAYYAALQSADAIESAVAESVRHVDADGDERRVDGILDAWRSGVVPLDE